ncbi:universal stress protein [uncultured Lentibacter sp.]|uniref:universal stress protein n=1 Tax=uncultured Lentibacter sp. TaxID=1659309 RepID=UPI002636BA81|nr:universal stress protein [uncultured Lentibacter sp.]
MSYKTIFTALTQDNLAQPMLEHTATLCETHDAHLEALCLGVDRSQTGYYYAGANALVLQEVIEKANEDALALEKLAEAELGKTVLRWSCDHGMAQLPDIGRHAAARARFADIAVLPTPYGDDRGPEQEALVEACLFEARVPVLVVPEKRAPLGAPKTVVIGWNESDEALGAVRAALPLLKQADNVHVVVIDPPKHGPNRSDPGGLLSVWLARHGVHGEIDVLSKTMPRVSDVLLRHGADIDADLVVMGAYGHSRFREAILGGATRYMLEQSKLPVFMAH